MCEKTAVLPVYGVNLPWLHGSYGHDLAVNEHYPDWGYAFDAAQAEKPFAEARALGFDAVRVWLCENAEGVVTDARGRVCGVHPALLENLGRLSEYAARESLTVYWTLLDANSWKREGDALTHAILTDVDQSARFAEHVAAPIARALDPKTTFALEVLNEPEVMTPACANEGEPAVEWDALGRAIRTIGDAVRAERAVPITAGTMHVFLDELWRCGAALDAVDVHVYHHDGGLPSVAQLAEHAGDPRIGVEIPVFGGECGLPQEETPPHARLAHYLYNAERDGYAALFLWRLEGWLVEQSDARVVTDAGKAVKLALLDKLPRLARSR